jgi:hypothetical protein
MIEKIEYYKIDKETFEDIVGEIDTIARQLKYGKPEDIPQIQKRVECLKEKMLNN